MGENGGKGYSMDKAKSQQDGGGFGKFLWNSDTGEFMGRNGGSWFKIIVFYIIFYFFLACFFLLCYYLFSLTLSDDKPKWSGDANIIGTNPGVGFRPMPDPEENEMSSLVWINGQKDKDDSKWGQQLDKFLKTKYAEKLGKNCTFEDGNKSDADGACDVDISLLESCTAKNNMYGYTGGVGTPCVLIKLNKIFSWVPEPYTDKDLELAKERDMPEALQDHIRAKSGSPEIDTTWITCEGKNPHDKEFITSDDLEYNSFGLTDTKFGGIPNYYFPFLKQASGYESPFVFVRFKKQLPNDVLIQMQCKAWAKNIIANKFERLGSVHFELLFTKP